MSKKTNLNRIKNIFDALLDEEPYQTNEFIIDYIFTYSRYTYIKNEMLDLLDANDFRKYKKYMSDLFNQQNDVKFLMNFIDKRYKLFTFKYINRFLSEKDYSEILMDCWTMEEFPSRDKNVTIDEFVEFFEKMNIDYAMEEDERKVFDNLDEFVTIYRGTKSINEDEFLYGLSWTLDVEQAKWFATRLDEIEGQSMLYKVVVPREEIFVYTNDREENEVIINPRNLYKYDIERTYL